MGERSARPFDPAQDKRSRRRLAAKSKSRAAKILIAEGDPDIAVSLMHLLRQNGWSVIITADGREAVRRAQTMQPALLITDISLSQMDGVQVLQAVKDIDPHIEVILITGHASVETVVAGLNAGAFAYLIKPFEDSIVIDTVRKALERRELLLERERLIARLQRSVAEVEQANLDLQRAHRELQHLTHLVDITRTLVAAHTPETLVQLIVKKARLIMGARLCTLRLVNAETGELELEGLAGPGHRPKTTLTKRMTLGERVTQQVMTDRKPVYIGDMTQAEGYVPFPQQVTRPHPDTPAPMPSARASELALNRVKGRGLGRGALVGAGVSPRSDGEQGWVRARQAQPLRALLAAPLRVGKQSIGVLAVYSATSNRYGKNEARVFSLLANYAATAIENARLYQGLRAERDKIIRAQEEARRELARDLHDDTAQLLATIALNSGYIQGLLDNDLDKARRELDNLRTTAQQAMKDVRSLIFRLRPLILETQGLVPALETYLGQVHREGGPVLHLEVADLPLPLSTKQENVVFSIVQEAVNNGLKHSQAQNIWLRLKKQRRSVQITVEDDGCGFDVAAVEHGYAQEIRLGLLTMRERAELIEGLLTIESTPGQGTRVVLTVPAQSKSRRRSTKE